MDKGWRRKWSKESLQTDKDKNNEYSDVEEKRNDATYIYKHIDCDEIGKGVFSQALLEKLEEKRTIIVPDYIKRAIIWACGGDCD